jgi:GntR family transcriptional regulator
VNNLKPGMVAAANTLYEEVATKLWDEIEQLGIPVGKRLPSERVLAGSLGVSRVTVRAGLTHLERLGRVKAEPQKGWFVTGLTPADESVDQMGFNHIGVQGLADISRVSGIPVQTKVLEHVVRPATISEAERLSIAPGAQICHLTRLRYLDNLVVAVHINQLPLALCPALETADFSQQSLYATLRAANPPVVPHSATYEVYARAPDAVETELLEIDSKTPVLETTKIAYQVDGRPMELSQSTYRSDRYRFRATLSA